MMHVCYDYPKNPKNFIDVLSDGLKCAEWKSKRRSLIQYTPDLFSSYFRYEFFENQLIVWKLFHEESKCLSPANAKSPINIKRYLHLTKDRGFMAYKMNKKFWASIVSINLDQNTYTLIGKNHYIEDQEYESEYWAGALFRLSENIFSVVVPDPYWEYSTIHFFKSNKTLSTCEFQRGILIPEFGKCFTMINGKLVYALFETINQMYDEMRVDAIMIREEDGTLKRLENTGVHLSKASFRYDSQLMSPHAYGHWDKDCLFFLLRYYERDRRPSDTTPFQTPFFFYLFQLNLQKWFEIRLNSPYLSKYASNFEFTIDDGILTFFQYEDEFICNKLSKTNIECYRIPLKRPEMLLNLTLFKVQHTCSFRANKHILPNLI